METYGSCFATKWYSHDRFFTQLEQNPLSMSPLGASVRLTNLNLCLLGILKGIESLTMRMAIILGAVSDCAGRETFSVSLTRSYPPLIQCQRVVYNALIIIKLIFYLECEPTKDKWLRCFLLIIYKLHRCPLFLHFILQSQPFPGQT